jgi:hypothetical protein
MGMTTKDVAAELHLSVNTVRSYTQTLMEKLGAHSRPGNRASPATPTHLIGSLTTSDAMPPIRC